MTAHVEHTFSPIYDDTSRILILGTFPSVKSREGMFYYHHPRNRFWSVIAQLTHETKPETIEDKKKMLLKHHIAVWDVIHSCDIEGSSDSSIRNVVAADIPAVLKEAPVEKIFGNGDKACQLYNKYVFPKTGKAIVKLPSTSPANAAFSMEKLVRVWGNELGPYFITQETAFPI